MEESEQNTEPELTRHVSGSPTIIVVTGILVTFFWHWIIHCPTLLLCKEHSYRELYSLHTGNCRGFFNIFRFL